MILINLLNLFLNTKITDLMSNCTKHSSILISARGPLSKNAPSFQAYVLALSGFTNVAKRLDVIVYPGNIRRVTGHARSECATSIRFQLITAWTWCVACVGRIPPQPIPRSLCPSIPLTIFDRVPNTHTSNIVYSH